MCAMKIERLELYKRLRDFRVPITVLDTIFNNDNDLKILLDAFNFLVDDGFQEDQAAEKISNIIFQDLDIEPDQSFDE